MASQSTQARLDQILPILQEPKFCTNRGLGNEIAFYVFDYPPDDELIVREYVAFMLKKLRTPDSPVHATEINLYDVVLDILKKKKVLDKIAPDEKKVGFEKVIQRLKPILKAENFIQHIQNAVTGDINLVLLTGVGNAFPLLRSHTVLNNLHHLFSGTPLIMFFPGIYDQTELRLFGKFKDDNYYRAFRLVKA